MCFAIGNDVRLSSPHNFQVRVLNYAPGPVITDMTTRDLQGDPNTEPALKEWSLKKMAEGGYLQPEQTAERLATLLKDDAFKSGQHVDYFD